jgi:hypothetical protein
VSKYISHKADGTQKCNLKVYALNLGDKIILNLWNAACL